MKPVLGSEGWQIVRGACLVGRGRWQPTRLCFCTLALQPLQYRTFFCRHRHVFACRPWGWHPKTLPLRHMADIHHLSDSTNCLVRGGECGYPEPTSASGSGSGTRATSRGDEVTAQGQQPSRPQVVRLLSSTPTDPFDSMPIPMPHKSKELFHHCEPPLTTKRTPKRQRSHR